MLNLIGAGPERIFRDVHTVLSRRYSQGPKLEEYPDEWYHPVLPSLQPLVMVGETRKAGPIGPS